MRAVRAPAMGPCGMAGLDLRWKRERDSAGRQLLSSERQIRAGTTESHSLEHWSHQIPFRGEVCKAVIDGYKFHVIFGWTLVVSPCRRRRT
ncbi:hypothetical protein C2845_PM07G20060 [Panicum miliaceum]|uniref:Uncharacterized protein n=1 Tax=Panicum miliaceum TaxID=4540 RepID=A0A3L6SRI2_PANMI|nr:hypothetical protein C2845_PM07G20060 [Panicum miliaceum]